MKNLSVIVQESIQGRSVTPDAAKLSASMLEAYANLATQATNVFEMVATHADGLTEPAKEAVRRVNQALQALSGDLAEKTYRLVDKSPSATRQAARHLAVGASRVQFEKLYAAFTKDNPQASFDDFKMALLVMADSFAEAKGITLGEASTSSRSRWTNYLGMVQAGSVLSGVINAALDNRDQAMNHLKTVLSKQLSRLNGGKKVTVLIDDSKGPRSELKIEIWGDDNPDRSGWDLSAVAKYLGVTERELKDPELAPYNRNGFMSVSLDFHDSKSYRDF